MQQTCCQIWYHFKNCNFEINYDSIRTQAYDSCYCWTKWLWKKYNNSIFRYCRYLYKCVFVLTADPKINVERVNARVASGGHEVPKDKIISRYYSSISNIKKLIELCDILHVYDNSLDKPVRIIRKHKTEFSIYPNKLWPQTKIINLIKS